MWAKIEITERQKETLKQIHPKHEREREREREKKTFVVFNDKIYFKMMEVDSNCNFFFLY